MKHILISFLLSFNLLHLNASEKKVEYLSDVIPKKMSVSEKKRRFFYLLVPAIKNVHKELEKQYFEIENDLKNITTSIKIETLKKRYKVKSNEELLLALKPHPISIVLAQAAMESAWATSRFFREANNVFGMWSYNKNEPRIAAGEKRNGKKTIWLKKFDSIESSVRAYYLMMGRGYAYEEFRHSRYESKNVFEMIKGLHSYSEIGEKYIQELASMIRYNKLTKYD